MKTIPIKSAEIEIRTGQAPGHLLRDEFGSRFRAALMGRPVRAPGDGVQSPAWTLSCRWPLWCGLMGQTTSSRPSCACSTVSASSHFLRPTRPSPMPDATLTRWLPTMHLQLPNVARAGVAVRTMLSNSFAFGGTNAVLVLRAAS